MMCSKFNLGLMAATIVSVAGYSVSAQPQNNTDRTGARDAVVDRAHSQGWDFRSAAWLKTRSVKNVNGEEVAGLADLILDRGSGTIDYAVLSTGTILGMGGRRMAISYDALQWNAGEGHFVLPLTPEQLEQFPEFSEDEWKGVTDKDSQAKTLRNRLMTDSAAAARDPYATSLEGATAARVTGTVTRVERRSYSDFGEHLVATVRTEDGAERRIALGPTWYVNSGAYAPMRGDKITVETLAIPRDPDRMLVATSMKTGDRSFVLRDERHAPAWVATTAEAPEARTNAARRYLLLSDLDGADVTCRGDACGTVSDVIVERGSGALAFLSIDPNENFLGIADTKRLVPWNVAAVTSEGDVRIDASKEMVLASPETPDDIATMSSGGMTETAYRSYEVDSPKFEARRTRVNAARPVGVDGEAWSHSGPICKGIKKDTLRSISGTGGSTREVTLGQGAGKATALTFKEGDEDVLVLLGPAWYIENQKIPCASAKRIRVDAYRTTIDGKDYWLAKSVDCDGTTVQLVDSNGSPVWDRQ